MPWRLVNVHVAVEPLLPGMGSTAVSMVAAIIQGADTPMPVSVLYAKHQIPLRLRRN